MNQRKKGDQTGESLRAVAAGACLFIGLVAGAASAEHGERPGAEELFRRGVEAFRAGEHADAVSLFRLSYQMQPRAETMCNLGLVFERWEGHDSEAITAFRRCAAEDETGRFRPRALEKARALEPSPAKVEAPWPSRSSITWEKLEKAPRCTFFSGPGGLGQNDQLGREGELIAAGETLSLTFDGGPQFRGRRMGKLITMSRRTVYTRDGGRWIVEESIAGILEEGVLLANYDYQECEVARRSTCPSPCSIHAELRVSLEQR